MALLLLFKVTVAFSVLFCYGAAVLRFVNEYFHFQFRKQLEAEYSQHPEMRNLVLDDFHDVVRQFPGDDNIIADGKSDVVDSKTYIKPGEQERSLSNDITFQSSSIDNKAVYDVNDERSNIGIHSLTEKAIDEQGHAEEKADENVFSYFEFSDPNHYYSILRSLQSGGHGRDQKPQSDFNDRIYTGSEWVSMSYATRMDATTDNTATTLMGDFQEVVTVNHHPNSYPPLDDDYSEENDVGEAVCERSTDHSPSNHHYNSDFSSCGGHTDQRQTSSADLSKEHVPNALSNGDGYYYGDAGESSGETNIFESDYYFRNDFQSHQMDNAYSKLHKYVQEQQQQMPLECKQEDHENHYGSYFKESCEPTDISQSDNLDSSSSSAVLSKSSWYFCILLLSRLLV